MQMPGWLLIRTILFKAVISLFFVLTPGGLEQGLSFYLLNPMQIQLNKGTPAYRAFEIVNSDSDRKDLENLSLPTTESDDGFKVFSLNAYSTDQLEIKLAEIKIPALLEPPQNSKTPLASRNLKMEVGGGLAVTLDNQIKIEKYKAGVLQEELPLDHKTGEFVVASHEPDEEYYAKLVNVKTGHILGEAKINLNSNLTKILPKAKSWVNSISFDEYALGLVNPFVKPNQAVSNKTHSGNANQAKAKTENPENSQTNSLLSMSSENPEDVPSSDSIIAQGQYIYAAQGPDGIKTFALLPSASNDTYIPTFSKKNITTLLDILQSQAHKTLDRRFIAIGSVKDPVGKGVPGVNLQMESDIQAKVFYFNDFFIPDVNLKETTSNGMFIILANHKGYQSLLAQKEEMFYAYANTVTTEGAVSFVEFKATKTANKAEIKSENPFNHQSVSSQMQLQGYSKLVQLNELKLTSKVTLELSGTQQVGLIYAVPENDNFENTKSVYVENQAEIIVPMIEKQWFQKVKAKLLNQEKQSTSEKLPNGSIVGFVDIEDFEVFVPELDRATTKIIYFNKDGLFLEGARGLKGGGFVLQNSKKGMQSFFIFDPKSKKFIPQILPMDGDDITTLRISDIP